MFSLRLRSGVVAYCLAMAAAAAGGAAYGTTYNVTSNSTLSTALGEVVAGDTVVLANGNYAGFTVSRSGTAAAPITIKAATQGSAVITSGIVHLDACSFIIVQGLKVTTSGGTVSTDSTTRAVGVWFDAATDCEVTHSTFALDGAAEGTGWVYLGGASNNNRIDYCEFGPNTVGEHTHYIFPSGNSVIPGVTPPADRTSWAEGNGPVNPNISRNTLIDHNYFHDMGSGDGETIVLGGIGVTGDYQSTNSIVEYNLFVNCNGDAEVVSVKSSSNILRYNTVRTSDGVFSLRSGNGSTINGNFFLCAGIGGGVKINEMNHTVYNNYIENTDTSNYPIMLENGDPYSSSSFAHGQVQNAHVMYNTCVNVGRQFLLGHGTSTLPPNNCVIANNIITGASGETLYSESAPTNCTWSQNVVNPTAVSGKTSAQFQVLDPGFTTVNSLQKIGSSSPVRGIADTDYFSLVTTDMDGQARDSAPDVGADEYSTGPIVQQPLATSDVGPNGTVSFRSGKYKIVDRNSGKSIVVQGASKLINAAIILYTFNASGNDEWTFSPLPDGNYEIINVNSALAAVVQSASTSPGAPVIQYTFGGSNTNDEWDFTSLSGGFWKIINNHSGLVMDVTGSGTSNGTVIDQNTSTGGNNQQFSVVSVP
jgi:poly(beta-D-mannuronate) lyase